MKKKKCSLCGKKGKEFYISPCFSCSRTIVISTTHKKEFSKEERRLIERIFINNKIAWEMKTIPDHAHCHILWNKDQRKKN